MNKKFRITKFYLIVVYFVVVTIFLSMASTYAWFSVSITNIGGDLNLGNLAGTVHIYESFNDSQNETEYDDGLTDAVSADSTGTNISTYDMIQKNWQSNDYTSMYIKVENTGSIDLKSILNVYYDNENIKTFLSYYYYHVVNITQEVNTHSGDSRERLSQYNNIFQDEISGNMEVYIDNIVSNGYSFVNYEDVINMGETEVSEHSFYRLDVALSEIPSELLTQFNQLSSEEREIKINANITLRQTNAPDTDEQDSGLSIYVSNANDFIYAVNSALNGDTIYLASNIVVTRNITITRRVNIVLNGYNLLINGNLAYDVGSSGSATLDVSANSILRISDSLIIDAPNTKFNVIGAGEQSESILIGSHDVEESGRFYVNVFKNNSDNEDYGYSQTGVAVMREVSEDVFALAEMTIDSNSAITIGIGSATGLIKTSPGAGNVLVYNLGKIYSVDFSNSEHLGNNQIQIYILNRNEFVLEENAITLPSWSLGWYSKELYSLPNPINTRVINAPGSNYNYTVQGSVTFTNEDIESSSIAEDSVVNIGENAYRVNMDLDIFGQDQLTIRYFLQEYYNNNFEDPTEEDFEIWVATIERLDVYTYNSSRVKILDFTFLNSDFDSLRILNLEFSNFEDLKIPNNAFYNKDVLEEVTLPVTDFEIGDNAFYGTSIGSIELHGNITSMGESAFDINTQKNGMLEVLYFGQTSSSLIAYLTGFSDEKTLLFMSRSVLNNFKDNFDIGHNWYINSYVTYDFISDGTYYRIIDTNSVEISYHSGNWEQLEIKNTVTHLGSTLAVVSVAESAFRRSINIAENARADLISPNNLLEIKADAFYDSNINVLDLNNVKHIGNRSFAYSNILESLDRAVGFSGMTYLGEMAFKGSVVGSENSSLINFESNNVSGGQIKSALNLMGNYTPGTAVFEDMSIYGVTLGLEDVELINESMTLGMQIFGSEINLKSVNTIGDNAFYYRFSSYEELMIYNKIDISNAKNIGNNVFGGYSLYEFKLGVTEGYESQSLVNENFNYASISNGIINSNFYVENLIIDGLLPEIGSDKETSLLGNNSGAREYKNVKISNTGNTIYAYMFYANTGINSISIESIIAHDILNIGSYAFYYTNVDSVSFYYEDIASDIAVETIGDRAFEYSNFSNSLGQLDALSLGQYAFANSDIPFDRISVSDSVANNAFYNSTVDADEINLSGTIGNSIFEDSTIYATEINFDGEAGTDVFRNSRVYDLAELTYINTDIKQHSFVDAIIYSAALINIEGEAHTNADAFMGLQANLATINLSNSLVISQSSLNNVNITSLILGNSSFSGNPSFNYGGQYGVFSGVSSTAIQNIYINGALPSERDGQYVLGAHNSKVWVDNVYIGDSVHELPSNIFYSQSSSNNLNVTQMIINSENLTIRSRAFFNSSIDNINYNASEYGNIVLEGDEIFAFTKLGGFNNFVYFDPIDGVDKGVLTNIPAYAFQYATFNQDSNIEMINYVESIGDYAFYGANFIASSSFEDVSFDFTKVENIGYNIFEELVSDIDEIILGNNDYYNNLGSTYYYGNPTGDEGILTSSGDLNIHAIVIEGNLPSTNITPGYQTRQLGISSNVNLNVGNVYIGENVDAISAFVFRGYSQSYRLGISNLYIESTQLTIERSAFAYTDISNMFIDGTDIYLNREAFEYAIVGSMDYSSLNGIGEISFESNAQRVFQYATIGDMTGFVNQETGVIKNVGPYAFYNANFSQDANIDWINYVDHISNYAFMYTNFESTSQGEHIDLDLSNVISIGEGVFAFTPNPISSLTLGNNDYISAHGSGYSYGDGDIGMMYAAGEVETLNIIGNLPNNNAYNVLGNAYEGIQWRVQYGTVNISENVTSIPSSAFISINAVNRLAIDVLNIYSDNIVVSSDAFKNLEVQTLNTLNVSLNLATSSFENAMINEINFDSDSINLSTSVFENSVINSFNNLSFIANAISMDGPQVFQNSSISNMNGFTFDVGGELYGALENASNYSFYNAQFAQGVDLEWISYLHAIGDYAFARSTLPGETQQENLNLNLTRALVIGSNAFYQIESELGVVTVGNDSLSSDPLFRYGNGIEGIFNNAGSIQHLTIEGALPSTSNSLGNYTPNINYLTTYEIIEITDGIYSLPAGVFSGTSSVYSTDIGLMVINSTSIVINERAFNYTVIQNFSIPNEININGIGSFAFSNSLINNVDIPNDINLTSYVNDYGLYGFNFSGISLNVSALSYAGAYSFSHITYNSSLVFEAPINLIDADFMFHNANISGGIDFNNIQSMGSNLLSGLISGNGVTYNFIFQNIMAVESDYAFANMDGGGEVFLNIYGLPKLDSYRAFYNSTNISTIFFGEDLSSLDADNVFEGASSLSTITLNNELFVVDVNETIVTIDGNTQIYVPGSLLTSYLSHPYWSLVLSQISTTYNIDSTGEWGFYLLYGTYDVSIERYLGSSSQVHVPETITYKSDQYTVDTLGPTVFNATPVTEIIVPRSINFVNMDMFSDANIQNVSLTGLGADPFHIETDGNGNKTIYESSDRMVLYKYLESNTAAVYQINSTVTKIARRAFYNNSYLEELTFAAGTIQTGNANSYTTTYPYNLSVADNAIAGNSNLTTLHLENNSSGFGVILAANSIIGNESLEELTIIGYQSIVNSFAIYNNPGLRLVAFDNATDKGFGNQGQVYSSLSIEPYAFFGSGDINEDSIFHTSTYQNYIATNAFANSNITIFEFNADPDDSQYTVDVYSPDAFSVGITIEISPEGDVIQKYAEIEIRVPDGLVGVYSALPGFSFHSDSIVGVTTFSYDSRF